MIEVIIDTILGAIFFGSISYLTQTFSEDKRLYKVIGFLWGIPLSYFFFMYISSKNGKLAMLDLSKHAVFGLLSTILIMIIIIYNIDSMSERTIIILSLIYGIIIFSLYFIFKLYKY